MNLDAGQKFNVFTDHEIFEIQKILSKIPDQQYAHHPLIYTNGFETTSPIYSEIKSLVIDRLNDEFGNIINKLTVGMQLISKKPFAPHSDFGGKNDSGHGYAFLIPLYMKHQDAVGQQKSHTIVFDQIFEGNNISDYIKTNPVKPVNNAVPLWFKHFACWPVELAEYLSVKLICPWEIGSVIYWDRRLVHSSDDFQANGIIEKSSLVLFCQ